MSKIIVVTGTSRGIGKAIVDELMELDPNVVVYGVARTEAALKQLATEYNGRFFYVAGDISQKSVQEELVSRIKKQHGYCDGLVANAGVLEPVAPVEEYDQEQWLTHFNINFFSIVSLVSQLLPQIEAARGNIVFVSSGASVKHYYGWSCYGAAKAALNSYAQALACEKPSIRSIAVAPGVVDTQMQVDIRDKFGPRSMTAESLKRFTDLQEQGQLLPPDVPGAVYAALVFKGIPKELNGAYIRLNDPRLAES
ncbi:similar to Saccharomyces cerevisiae YIR035C Putative cytoplasmic protein of unknown function [Maudiozyma saulgeensis]|uniref:Uncharacterized protein n=1 Tax=Maudiozyma saulgeensis TaxID=1789683 RepID=A0A1X7RAW7_9SACH|nr:similar to Saccharomyces cerevisiae YIR035C Putative cytoplasmic protein of unknown function [Kazachstania saulgeensis]